MKKLYLTNEEKKHIQTSIELTWDSLLNQLVTEILENKDVNNLNRSLYTKTLIKYIIKTFISHLKWEDMIVREPKWLLDILKESWLLDMLKESKTLQEQKGK